MHIAVTFAGFVHAVEQLQTKLTQNLQPQPSKRHFLKFCMQELVSVAAGDKYLQSAFLFFSYFSLFFFFDLIHPSLF